jgi:hypothetical protein
MLNSLSGIGETLRVQFMQSQLESRKHNGYGFFTTFIVPEAVPICSLIDERVHANALVGNELCGFMLWIRNGRINFLEGYPLGGDAWPQNENFTELRMT